MPYRIRRVVLEGVRRHGCVEYRRSDSLTKLGLNGTKESTAALRKKLQSIFCERYLAKELAGVFYRGCTILNVAD